MIDYQEIRLLHGRSLKTIQTRIGIIIVYHKISLIVENIIGQKKLHKFYSKQIKQEIIHLIWIWKKSEIVSKLPKDILYLIIEILY
jgi:hypothetical protein